MPIFHRVDDEGGFVCGDPESRVTAYAYPTSEHARQAARGMAHASKVAKVMLTHETYWRQSGVTRPTAEEVSAQDDRNWAKLAI